MYICCFFRQKVKGPAKIVDTGAGFFLEEEDEVKNNINNL
jgi:hypothetical protein